MENSKEQTCEQRIDGQLQSVIETLQRLYRCTDAQDVDELSNEDISEALNIRAEDITDEDRADLGKIQESAQERISELPLSVSVKRVITVQLSWGGPSDEFEAEIDGRGELQSNVTYIFKDWFDGARRETSDEAVERFVSYFAENASLE